MTTCACGNCQFFDNQSKAAANLRKDHSGPVPEQVHLGSKVDVKGVD